MATIFASIVISSLVALGSSQYSFTTKQQAVTPSEELLHLCRELDIPLEECNQVTILQNQPTGGPTGGIRNSDTWLYWIMIPIGVGSTIAGIVAFFILRRLKET